MMPDAPAKSPTLIFLRHAATEYNDPAKERVRGRADVPATYEGLQELKRYAKPVVNKYRIAAIHYSPMSRTTASAKTLAGMLNGNGHKPVLVSDRSLLPWNNGDYEGRLVKEVLPQLQALEQKTPDKPAPGGESFDAFKSRLLTGVKRLMAEAERRAGEGAVIAVTSSRNADTISAWHENGMQGMEVGRHLKDRQDILNNSEAMVLTKVKGYWELIGGKTKAREAVVGRQSAAS